MIASSVCIAIGVGILLAMNAFHSKGAVYLRWLGAGLILLGLKAIALQMVLRSL